jgi:DNA-binding NarL/FixJ family response regulator
MLHKRKPPKYQVEMSKTNILTRQETKVVRLVCMGLCDKQISDALDVAIGTVGKYLESVYRKLDLVNEQANRRCYLVGMMNAYGVAKFIPVED